MNRSLKLSIVLALGLGSAHAAALELGQIQIKSALGQPLLAEIPLSPESPADMRNLSARLASPEDFARAGIAGGRPSIPLQFSVATEGARKVIRITSSEPVSDPYLDLLVEVNSATGKSVREFAILLDPPGMAPMPSQPAPSSVARSQPAPSAASSAPRTAAAPSSSPAPRSAGVSNGKIGPVERGQTLTAIARQTTPPGVDENQMLLALKQANPEAFYRDNVNALKSGAVLRVPTSQEAQALGAAAALTEIRRENSDWRAGATRSPTTVADAATRADTSSAPTSAPSGGDRLALVPSKQGGASDGSSAGSKNAAAAAKLRQDLARDQETVSSLQAQSGELKSRVKDLEDINGKNQRLLSLKDSEIADLQQQLAKARNAAHPPAAAASAPAITASTAAVVGNAGVAPLAAATPAKAGSVATAAGSTPATAASAAPAMAATALKPAAQPVAKRAAASPVEEAPWYMQPWAWAAAAGAIVLLLLLALLGRRRKPRTAAGSSLADRFGALPATDGTDPDQDELLDQLSEHPEDIELHRELATLYYSRGDVEHFEATAEAMHAHVTDPQQDEWQDVVRMGEDLAPSHPLFAGDQATAYDDYDDEAEPADVSVESSDDEYALADPLDDDPMPGIPPLPQRKLGEYHFDFDLSGPRARDSSALADSSEVAIDADGAPASDAYDSGAFDAEEDTTHADGELPATAGSYGSIETAAAEPEPISTWNFDEPKDFDVSSETSDEAPAQEFGQFSDDPIDTKLDLARAYMDMGDAEGARAMLEEVQQEGNQMQQDAARHLLENIH